MADGRRSRRCAPVFGGAGEPQMQIIPQIQPWIGEDEAVAVRDAVASTFVTEHEQTRRFERGLRELTGAAHALTYCNASCALFAALRAGGVGPGDEVIVPDLTFVATANAVILAGATPVFVDVEPRTLGLDAAAVRAALSPRTRALIAAHLYGGAADMVSLRAVADEHGLFLLEDAAQGIGVRLGGRHVGTFGDAGVLSFYGNKTITTGEGGAILTSDGRLAERCYRLKNHGRLEKGVFVHDEVGFNFSFTEMQAALGLAQLRRLERVIAEKARIRRYYAARLGQSGLRVQEYPPDVSPVYWFTNVFCDDAAAVSAALAAQGVQSRRFFLPLHMQPCYRNLPPADCPQSRRLYETGLSLPSGCTLTERELDRVCRAIENCGVAAT